MFVVDLKPSLHGMFLCIRNHLFTILLKGLGRFDLDVIMMLHTREACDSLKKTNADVLIRSLRIKLFVT